MKRGVVLAAGLVMVACGGKKNQLGNSPAGTVVVDFAVANGSAEPVGAPVETPLSLKVADATTMKVAVTARIAQQGGAIMQVRATLVDGTDFKITKGSCELPPAPTAPTFVICSFGAAFDTGENGEYRGGGGFFDVCSDGRAMVADRGPADQTPCKK